VTSLDSASGASTPPDPSILDPNDPDPVARATLLVWLRIQAAFGFRPQDACTALRGGLAPAELWQRAAPSSRARAERIQIGGALWRALEDCGAKALPWAAAAYPERLRRLAAAPPVLFVQGDPAVLARRCVAVVGARAASAYGRRIASEFAAEITRAGVVVVSGLAHGVDGAAHAGALEAGGLTVAVQGRGPDGVYPASHRGLAQRIRTSGALLSEFAPRVPPRAGHFPLRNRIISALSEAVVVVEARMRSGSLGTARHALDQGVDVFAVPGPIDAPTSEGPNRLLRDGAGAVLEPADVLAAIGLEPLAGPPAAGPPLPREQLARRLVRALRDCPATRDELAARLDLAPEDLALAIAELELLGWLEPGHDGRLRLARSR